MAVVDAMGLIESGTPFVHESLIGTRFTGLALGWTAITFSVVGFVNSFPLLVALALASGLGSGALSVCRRSVLSGCSHVKYKCRCRDKVSL